MRRVARLISRAALAAVLVLAVVAFLRTAFDRSSEAYRRAHPPVVGDWSGVLSAAMPPAPRRERYGSDASYREDLQNWKQLWRNVRDDTRGVRVRVRSLLFGRGGEVTMCAPDGARAEFEVSIEAIDDHAFRAVLDLREGGHDGGSDARVREAGDLDLREAGGVARASYGMFGNTISGPLTRGDAAGFERACARVRAAMS